MGREEDLKLERQARANTVGKSLSEMSRELDSRIRDVEGNLELGPKHYDKVHQEIENDIAKSRALAKAILSRLDATEAYHAHRMSKVSTRPKGSLNA